MRTSPGIAATLARAWDLLRRNWIIIVPSVVIGAVSAAAATVLARSGWLSWQFFGGLNDQGPGAYWSFLAAVVAMALRLVVAVIAMAFTAGMAAAAWTRGRAVFADGTAVFRRNGLHAFFALLLLTLIGIFAAALLLPTFGLSVLAYMTFMLYAMPAVLVGNRGAVDGIVESIGIAWRSFGVTFVLVLLIVALAIAGGMLGNLLEHLPFLGALLNWILMEAMVAYATLVVVGEYLQLNAPADQAP
jgi:hypothetical protein